MSDEIASSIGIWLIVVFTVAIGLFLFYRAGPGWVRFRETNDGKRLIRGSGGELGPRIACIGVGVFSIALGAIIRIWF